METRFKRFIRARRRRSAAEVDNDLVHRSAPYEASSPASRAPIFLYQPLAKSALEIRRDGEKDTVPLRSFSYKQVVPGKAPIFIQSLPQKGNGPVKLQANRRLSSGELTTTVQDSQMTLQDIKDGDYLVGRKERSMSFSKGTSNLNVNETRTSHVHSVDHSPVPTPNSRTPTTQTRPSTPCLIRDSPGSDKMDNHDQAVSNVGLGLSSPTSTFSSRLRPSQDLNVDCRSSLSCHSISHGSSRSHHNSMQTGNATLQALRKAEYSRLVDIYGADAAARNLAQLDREHLKAANSPVSPLHPPYSSVIFEPLPAPPTEIRDSEAKNASRLSGTSSEWSGTSSPQRRSYVSSYAESSTATTQTSVMEDDPVATREDIRSMVEQMRSTYLNAIEQRTPASARSKPRKKKQRKPKLVLSPAITPSDQHSPRAPPLSGRQTWHPDDSDHDAPYTRRINSQPVSGTGRLSPIQASPRRREDSEAGITRTDSTTLGGFMAGITRSRIRASHSLTRNTKHESVVSQASHPRPVTPQQPTREGKRDSWLNLESDSAEELFLESPHEVSLVPQQPRGVSQYSVKKDTPDYVEHRTSASFEEIYDLFGKESGDSWSSSPNVGRMSSLRNTSSDATKSITNLEATTSKASQILSIPESPEYTHLARPGQHADYFI